MNKKRCGAKTRNGTPCKRSPMPNGRCKLHGGASLRGAAHPNFKDGSRSKYMPKTLRAIDADVAAHPLTDTLADNIALNELFLRERLSELEKMPDSEKSWANMSRALDSIEAAYTAMSDPKMASALLKARGIVEDNTRKWEAVRDIQSFMQNQRADIKTRADITYKEQTVMTANEALTLASGIAAILLELHIEKSKINEFLIRLDRLITPKHPQSILTDHTPDTTG